MMFYEDLPPRYSEGPQQQFGRTAAAIRKDRSCYSEGPQVLFGRTAGHLSVPPVFCCGPSEKLSENADSQRPQTTIRFLAKTRPFRRVINRMVTNVTKSFVMGSFVVS
ncbi:hypothetical protein Y032_0014g2490 [Ancylostoma ceylanicum]|uniref:Uncharacterized protein n=1 Tax=Ancylostoma ceylanicum TaxID=53326 RepID=A0A016VAW1_9BILA|nr:hypothetical protein Y032_0014g2490 [Ancylostoma ceylanicum]